VSPCIFPGFFFFVSRSFALVRTNLSVNIREHTINRAEIANCGAPGCLRSLAAYINRNRKPSLNQKTATQSELHRSFLNKLRDVSTCGVDQFLIEYAYRSQRTSYILRVNRQIFRIPYCQVCSVSIFRYTLTGIVDDRKWYRFLLIDNLNSSRVIRDVGLVARP
jgi:hypothetical protein